VWDSVSVLNCLLVESSEVDAEPEGATFLADKEDQRAVWPFLRFDKSASKEVGELDATFVQFRDGEAIC
jgi:hypothetical protein